MALQLLLRRSGAAAFSRACSGASPARLLLMSRDERDAMGPHSAREFTVQLPSSDRQHVRMLEIFLVRGSDEEPKLRAYKNFCPHAGGPLNMFTDVFFRDGFLLCTRHAASFRWQDGVCVSGPCPGAKLFPLEIDDCPENGVSAGVDALVELSLQGSRGSLLKPISKAHGDGGVQIVPRTTMPNTFRRRAKVVSPAEDADRR